MSEYNSHVKITDSQPRVRYVADGFQIEFPFTFQIVKNTDLDIYVDDQKQASNYTVSGEGDTSGGVIVLSEAPSAGTIVTLVRNTPIQRTSDFQQSGMFQAKVLNDELDLLTAALQDVAEDVRRSVKLTVVDSDANLDLPRKVDRANHFLGFDADGNATVFGSTGNGDGAAVPGGSGGQVQFNDGGKFGGAIGLTYAKSTNTLSVAGGVRADTIDAKTTGAGVTVEGVLVKGGAIDGRDVSIDGAKLDGIEPGADTTDAANVNAAGAVMNTDSSTAAMSFVIDDDSMATATGTTVATSKSVKAYVDAMTWDATDIVSGAFANARIAQSSVTQHEAAIDHDALTNFVANEHIDWTAASAPLATSGAAATGALTVTGDIAVSGTVDGRDIAADGATLDGLSAGSAGIPGAATVAAMSALTGTSFPAGFKIFVDTYAQAGDAGGGWFEARNSGDTVDNGFVFNHDFGGSMRWHRLLVGDGACSVAYFGATGDGITDDTTAIQAALDSGAGRVVFPPGTYKVTSSLVPAEYQIMEGLNGWENVEIVGSSVTGGIIEPNDSYADAVKTRIQIRGLKISGTADYGIRIINCTYASIENIRFNFGAVAEVSDLTYDCLYMGDSWESRVSFITAFVETATTTPARSVIWLDGAMNGVLADTVRTTAATRYGIVLSNTDSGGSEIPTAITINNATLQRQEIGIYAKRCRSVNASGLYFEKTQIPIRLGSDDSSTDRCAGFAVVGAYFNSSDGTDYGWGGNATGVIEAVRAYGCTFSGCNFSDYGSGDSEHMLYVKRCWGLRIDGPTRFNFAMSDMRPAIRYDAGWDTSSTYTIAGNGSKGGQTISTGLSTEFGAAAPVSGAYEVGDRVINSAPSAGGVEGWICTSPGSPGIWKTLGQIGN